MKNAILAFLFSIGFYSVECEASSPLGLQSDIDKAFSQSTAIIKARVVSKIEVWTLCGEVISRQEAMAIEAAILKFQLDFREQQKTLTEEAEFRAIVDEWEKTEMGKKSKKPISCLIIATMAPIQIIKGDYEGIDSVIHASWTSGILHTCSDVSVETSKDSEVLLFMMTERAKGSHTYGVGHGNSLLIGSTDMKPTRADQGADDRSATAVEAKTQ